MSPWNHKVWDTSEHYPQTHTHTHTHTHMCICIFHIDSISLENTNTYMLERRRFNGQEEKSFKL